jgi:hypothetical protein
MYVLRINVKNLQKSETKTRRTAFCIATARMPRVFYLLRRKRNDSTLAAPNITSHRFET